MRVFVVTLEGIETQASSRLLTVLAFVRAEAGDSAEAVAAAELSALGWTGVTALRNGEVVNPDSLPDDFLESMATALREGCALIIYEAP